MQNYGDYGSQPPRRPPQEPGEASPSPQPYRPPAREGAGRPTPPRGGASPGRRSPRQPAKASRRAGVLGWFQAMIMVLITVGFCFFLALFIVDAGNELFGLNQEDRPTVVEIPKDITLNQLGKILLENEIIQKPFVFGIYAGLKTDGDNFYPGKYTLNPNMGYSGILLALQSGWFIKEEVSVTFIEGRTVIEIANLLEEKEVCSADEFLAYMKTAELNFPFIEAIPDSSLRFRRLEGYLFPNTHTFYKGESVASVTKKFLDDFNKQFTDEMEEKREELEMSLDEVVILASIIQREAGKPEDMKKVSGVFHNRLANSTDYPRLQSDVTIFYVNNNINPYQTPKNQEMNDAYNTYVREGLPIGPICNPGLDAIEAALNPEKSDYYYFVTDSEGEFYYSKTLEEHMRNVAKAEAVGDGEAHGIDTQD